MNPRALCEMSAAFAAADRRVWIPSALDVLADESVAKARHLPQPQAWLGFGLANLDPNPNRTRTQTRTLILTLTLILTGRASS